MWIAVIGVGGTLMAAIAGQVAQIVLSGRQHTWAREDAEAASERERALQREQWEREEHRRLFNERKDAYIRAIDATESLHEQLEVALVMRAHGPYDMSSIERLIDTLDNARMRIYLLAGRDVHDAAQRFGAALGAAVVALCQDDDEFDAEQAAESLRKLGHLKDLLRTVMRDELGIEESILVSYTPLGGDQKD